MNAQGNPSPRKRPVSRTPRKMVPENPQYSDLVDQRGPEMPILSSVGSKIDIVKDIVEDYPDADGNQHDLGLNPPPTPKPSRKRKRAPSVSSSDSSSSEQLINLALATADANAAVSTETKINKPKRIPKTTLLEQQIETYRNTLTERIEELERKLSKMEKVVY